MAEDLDRDCATNHLLDVGADQRQLRHRPERVPRPRRILLPAELGEVPTGGDAEPRRQELDEEAHDGGPEQQPEEGVAGGGAGLEIALEVAGIEEGDAHEEAGAGEEPKLLP